MSSPAFAAVVVSFNSRADLPACLEALLAQVPRPQVVVVDNASRDGSPELVRERFPQVQLLALEHNTGFAGGCNRGWARVREAADVVVFLNPDVVVRSGCLAACGAALAADRQLGGVAPLLLRADGRTVDSAGQVLDPLLLEVRDRGYGEPLGPRLRERRPVLAACGALAVYRCAALREVERADGPWAERFFCFWEDLELGWRLSNAGWRIDVLPRATAEHARGAGARPGRGPLRWRRPVELEACIVTNRWMTLARHLHTVDLALRWPLLVGWDLVVVGAGIVRRPRLALAVARRLRLVRGEWRARRGWPRRRLKDLPRQ